MRMPLPDLRSPSFSSATRTRSCSIRMGRPSPTLARLADTAGSAAVAAQQAGAEKEHGGGAQDGGDQLAADLPVGGMRLLRDLDPHRLDFPPDDLLGAEPGDKLVDRGAEVDSALGELGLERGHLGRRRGRDGRGRAAHRRSPPRATELVGKPYRPRSLRSLATWPVALTL